LRNTGLAEETARSHAGCSGQRDSSVDAVVARLAGLSIELSLTPTAPAAFIAAETANRTKVVKFSGIKPA